MQNYMLTVLVNNQVDEKARVVTFDAIKKHFGNLKKEDLWGSRGLAYPIAHQDKAYFAHYEFESEPSAISSLDKMVKLNEDVIRYLLLRVDLPKKVAKLKKVVVKTSAEKTTETDTTTEEVAEEKE